jgi:hypothetical protein
MKGNRHEDINGWQGRQCGYHGLNEMLGERTFSAIFEQDNGFPEWRLIREQTPGLGKGWWFGATGSTFMGWTLL